MTQSYSGWKFYELRKKENMYERIVKYARKNVKHAKFKYS